MSVIFAAAAEQLTGPRAHQNDSYFVGATWAAVADGVGSDPSSRNTADLVVNHFASIARGEHGDDFALALLRSPEVLSASLTAAAAGGDSTVAAAILDPAGRLWLVAVGDSRVALVRDGTLIATNRLHNQAEYGALMDASYEAPWGAASSLTRAIGSRQPGVPEVQVLLPRIGDTIVLLTDGVDAKLNVSQLVDAVWTAPSPATACHALLELASRTELADNATCVVVVIAEGTETHAD